MIEGGRLVATDHAPDVGWLIKGDQPILGLVGPTWTLESEVVVNGETMTLVQSITFGEGGAVAFDSGCNLGTASTTYGASTLQVEDIETTFAGCSPAVAELDAAFMAVLSAGEIEYVLADGVLDLRSGSNLLRFSATYRGPPGN
jgi:hypothetical protein